MRVCFIDMTRVYLTLIVVVTACGLLSGHAEARGGGRSSGGRSGGGRFGGYGSSGSRLGSGVSRGSSVRAPTKVSPISYPKQRWGFATSTGPMLRPATVPSRAYASYFRPGGRINSNSQRQRLLSMNKKTVGLGVAAGFLAGASYTGYLGAGAYAGALHRYHQYQYMVARHRHYLVQPYEEKPLLPAKYLDPIYENDDLCAESCPTDTICVAGVCECRQVDGAESATVRRNGTCHQNIRLIEDCEPFPACSSCVDTASCQVMDVNLVCGNMTAIRTGNRFNRMNGVCYCRNDMRWNPDSQQCEVFIEADCSGFDLNTTLSSELEAVINATMIEESRREDGAGGIVLSLNMSKEEALGSSLLMNVNLNASEDVLLEAYCHDVDAFMEAVSEADPHRPSPCPRVPEAACAIVFDSHDCSGGWELEVPEGKLNFPYFSASWRYRNDIDTVGVRRGCTLTAYSGTDFQRNSGVFRAGPTDGWWVLEEDENVQHLANDIESLECTCNATSVTDLFT